MMRTLPLESTSPAASPPRLIPRSVWRKLLLSPPLPTSSRVLFCGANPLGDARTLAALPLDLCVVCENAADVFTLRRELPAYDVDLLVHALQRLEPRSADMVILHNAATFQANLFDATVRQHTAEWLSLLKPNGRLVFLQESDTASGHLPDCFPGRIDDREAWDSLFDWSRWELFGPREHRPTTHLVSITVPNEELTPADWRDYARHGLLTSQRTCCASAAAEAPPAGLRRVA
jgi:hypothetical protein